MSASEESLNLLRSIDASLKALLRQSPSATANEQAIAPDSDLDGQYGNPIVKFHPRDWSGESCKERPMSDCPAPFLDLLAETFDYFAGKAEASNELTASGKPVAQFKRKDAARARGWARRIRNGYKPAAQSFEDEAAETSTWQ